MKKLLVFLMAALMVVAMAVAGCGGDKKADKAAGGAVLFTPANGFKVDIVESITNGYKLYW